MLPPPPQGNVYDFIPPGTPNAEPLGVLQAWNAWQVFVSQALPDGLDQLQFLQGVPQ